jgi:CubicO group peptidase (beta-lactamase class C family)
MRKHLSVLLFILLSVTAAGVQAQSVVPPFITDSLDAYISRGLKNWNIPGASVCVVKDGKVVLMKGYGVTEIGSNTKVDENTLFMIGSNTKAFTATALGMLEEQHQLSLNDPVRKWLPEFKLNNQAAGEQAIITDLLCHRIGFMTFQGDFTYWTSNLSREEVIEKMSHIKAAYPFRTTWGYTNAAFVTAGQIIPKASGETWEGFVTNHIFKPLGMDRTIALSKDLTAANNKALAHTYQDGKMISVPYAMIDNLAPAGSISSSANDLSKWVLMQLNNGMYNGTQVVPAYVIGATRTPHSILGDGGSMFNRSHFALYGLGWFLSEYEGRKIVAHTGGVNGFVTGVTLIPEEKLGIIVLTNTDQNEFFEALKSEILDSYLKLPYRGYSELFLQYNSKQQEESLKTDKLLKDSAALKLPALLQLKEYTGSYRNDVYGDMKVVQENGELRMRFSHHPHMYAKLESLGGNRFYATFSDPVFNKAIFPFKVTNGKVTAVTVKVADFIEYDPYEFEKMR